MTDFNIGFIKAETHTPEYLMHKYWARKPHNVISECIEALTSENGIVIDPFCGSGVVLREGSRLGRKCYGFDLNPSAELITRVLINPPQLELYVNEFERIFNVVNQKYGYLYKTISGENIKYLSHRIVTKCDCGEIVHQEDCNKTGRRLICPNCGKGMHFNLENLIDTDIFDITVENTKDFKASIDEIKRQKEFSMFASEEENISQFDFYFPENRRILAFKGIKTSDFFTKRNFTILTAFATEIWKVTEESVRDCLLLLLTSSVAQCSRLIAHRNNFSTGGPAWSVPGFWIPQEHMEGNPFFHLRARFNKYIKAIKYLEMNPAKAKAEVYCGNSLELLNQKRNANLKADLIFLDPPYGDSVPYTEFSNIWNSFLKNIPVSDDDISVSDRIDKNESWHRYQIMLDRYMKCFKEHLTQNGKLLITFNNNDMKAWSALISALQKNGYICKSVFYQIPAVISSKAQMSINSSYISDVYSVYSLEQDKNPSKDYSPLLSHLCFVANTRGGILSRVVLDREFIISWLKNNISYELLNEKEHIINSVFNLNNDTNTYSLKEEYRRNTVQLSTEVKKCMDALLKNGAFSILDCYINVCSQCEEYGTMELSEFKEYIKEYAVENGRIYGNTQLSLF